MGLRGYLMNKLFWRGVLAAVLVASAPSPAAAGEISLNIANGRVTLIAQDVTIRQILAEWARVGQTQIVNGEQMMGAPVTLELRDVPEAKALETVLRSAAGYVVAPRLTAAAGGSEYGRIVILATSRAPVVSASAPPPFRAPRPIPQPLMPQVDNTGEQTEVDDSGQGAPQFPGPTNQPGMQPGQPMPEGQQEPAPVTAPRPGIPQQPAGPGNPYQPQPGVRPPGSPGGPPRAPGGPGGGGDGSGAAMVPAP